MATIPCRLKLLFILMVMICSCTKSMEREPPVTVSDVLNEFVRSAPFQYLNLDDAKSFEIELTDEDIIYDVNRETGNGPLLGQITDFVVSNDHFYVYDMNTNAVFLIEKEGEVKGPLTRSGAGPGEHGGIRNLRSNNNYIFGSDINNARINRYSHDMVAIDALYGFRSMFLDLNNERILTDNRNSVGFAPEKPEQGIISVSSIYDLSDTLATILPRIIPYGYQPDVYNNPLFSINNQNKIVATYSPLPWLFLFDEEFNLTRTLILEYSIFDEMDIPEMDFFRPQGNQGFGGMMPITQYKIMDNGDLFITIERELIHLTPIHAGKYEVTGKYRFNYSGATYPMWDFSSVPEGGEQNIFYARNHEYLFRLNLFN